jgi:probable F420-dependent oxidoreductase
MDIELGALGAYLLTEAATADQAVALEEAGYGTVWLAGSPPADLIKAEELLDATTRIVVGTSVLNVWTAAPETVAAAYHRIVGRHPGRLMLGIGAGHRETNVGYAAPYAKMVAYLDALAAASVPASRLLLAALGPKMLQLAADRTAGTVTVQVTPEHTRWAREILGPGKLVIPGHMVVLDTDVERARATGRAMVTPALHVTNYSGNLRRLGFTDQDLADPGSDRLIDALVLHGDAAAIAAGLRAELDAGADHVGVSAVGNDAIATFRTVAEAMRA